MIPVSRRAIFGSFIASTVSGLAGCIDISTNIGENGDPDPRLRVYPRVEQTRDSWEMSVRVRNMYDWDTSFHDVTVVAFDESGTEVCRVDVGDFPQNGRFEASKTISCREFPAIVTATAEESPCDGANIGITYWTGPDDLRGEEIPEGRIVWDRTFRECNEDLAPDRVIANVSTSASVNQES